MRIDRVQLDYRTQDELHSVLDYLVSNDIPFEFLGARSIAISGYAVATLRSTHVVQRATNYLDDLADFERRARFRDRLVQERPSTWPKFKSLWDEYLTEVAMESARRKST